MTDADQPLAAYLTQADIYNVTAAASSLRLAAVTAKPGLVKSCYKSAGVHLARLRHRHQRAAWIEIVTEYVGISTRRAYELMAMATGVKRVELLRAENARQKKEARKNKRLASATMVETCLFSADGPEKSSDQSRA